MTSKQSNNRVKGFWNRIITSGTGFSSKRLMGVACILFSMIYSIMAILMGEAGCVDGVASTIVMEFLTAGVALFGVTAWEKKYRKPNKSHDIPNDSYDEDDLCVDDSYVDYKGGCDCNKEKYNDH